jgi:ketosteroid isomerase-like protein
LRRTLSRRTQEATVGEQTPPTVDADRSAEARATYARYVEERGRAERGEVAWSALAEAFFTDDAVFVDPAWGRAEGREAIARFFDESMAGLDGWTFPQEFALADGDGERVVALWWNRLGDAGPDGRPFQAPGVSILHYAGEGRFSYELDILNMAEVIELIGASGWTPPATFNAPPRDPVRDPTPPAGTARP